MRFNHNGVIGEIDNLPGCSQIGVLHSVFAFEETRGVGRGSTAHKQRLDEAFALGYNVVMCTADTKNEPQIKILNNNNWKLVHEFVSSKTGHSVGIFIKEIN